MRPEHLFLLIAATLCGCARVATRPAPSTPPAPYVDPYDRTELDEVLGYAESFARRSAPARVEECRTLLRRRTESPGPGVELRLLFGRLLSDACGDIPSLQKGLAALPPAALRDENLRRLVAVQTEVLKALQGASKSGHSVRKRVVVVRRPAKPAVCPQPSAPSDEAKILREKLDEIRSIEHGIDHAGSDK